MSTDYLTIEPYTLQAFQEVSEGVSHGAQDVEEVECSDGTIHVLFTRYGLSRVDDLLETIPCWSEHDDEFEALISPRETEEDG